MPSCLGASGSVRTSRNIQSAWSAYEVQTFWPVTMKSSPSTHRARLQAGEVGAGAGLGVALAPADLAADDRRDVRALELLGAELQQRRADHRQAEADQRRAQAQGGHLLREDARLLLAQPAAAVLRRPGRRGPAARRHDVEPALHVGIRVDGVCARPSTALRARRAASTSTRRVGLQPRAGLAPERLEISHSQLLRPPTFERARRRVNGRESRRTLRLPGTAGGPPAARNGADDCGPEPSARMIAARAHAPPHRLVVAHSGRAARGPGRPHSKRSYWRAHTISESPIIWKLISRPLILLLTDRPRTIGPFHASDLPSEHQHLLEGEHLRGAVPGRRGAVRPRRLNRSRLRHAGQAWRASSRCRSATSITPASSASTAATATPRSRPRANAGFPPTQTCMNCHSQIWTQSPTLEPVRASWRTGESINWTKVYDLPDFVYFNHSIHVAKGVGCVELPRARRQDEPDLPGAVAAHGVVPRLPPQPGADTSARARRSSTWRGSRPADEPNLGAELVAAHDIHGRQDCTTCHR